MAARATAAQEMTMYEVWHQGYLVFAGLTRAQAQKEAARMRNRGLQRVEIYHVVEA